MTQVNIFADFKEDKRKSMDIYADYLYNHLNAHTSKDYQADKFVPNFSPWLSMLPNRFSLRMRAARYIDYPRQVNSIQHQAINHIIEDGYAHIVRKLDPAKTVITIHDLIPLLAWNGFIKGLSYPHRPRLYEYSLKYIKQFAQVITISESTRQDLIKFNITDAEKITVIPYGTGASFQPLTIPKVKLRQQLSLPIDGQLILITGEKTYKNHATCIKVIQELQKRTVSTVYLVRLGIDNEEWQQLETSTPLNNKVIKIESLPHHQMSMLYNAADLLLFPSWYEGFGRPPLEAMACGLPTLTSNIPALAEVVGRKQLSAAPDDVEQLTHLALKILTDSDLHKQLSHQGIEQAGKFTWKKNIEKTMAVYDDILNRISQ